MNQAQEFDWKKKDARYVWHPFTQMKEYREEAPPVIREGDGVTLTDTDGNTYYDGVSSIWLNVHGHGCEDMDRAIRDQLDHIAHSTLLGLGNVPSIRLAERLADVTPEGLTRVFFADSGANAVEIGMKMAIQFYANRKGCPTDKQRFLTFEGGYHGDTFGPMSVVPDETFHGPFENMLPEPVQVPFPHSYRWPGSAVQPGNVRDECLERVETKLDRHANELAGIMVEPVQGAGGMRPAPDGFLAGLRSLCNEYNVMLLVDEVATGFGRTGSLFACDHDEVTPDILTLGKGITGGYLPVSATLATERIYESFLGNTGEKTALFHGHSYTGNALGCAAGIASLDRLQEHVMPELPGRIETVRKHLAPLQELPFVGNVRQKGLMCGIELVADEEKKTPFPYEAEAGHIVRKKAQEKGLLMRPIGNHVLFLPPLVTEEEDLIRMIDILRESISGAESELLRAARSTDGEST